MVLLFQPIIALPASSAGQLLRYCESSSIDYCKGYISGFYDGRTTNDYGIKELMACFPVDYSSHNLLVSYEEMRKAFIKWAHDNPKKLDYEDWRAVREAFSEAWPCK